MKRALGIFGVVLALALAAGCEEKKEGTSVTVDGKTGKVEVKVDGKDKAHVKVDGEKGGVDIQGGGGTVKIGGETGGIKIDGPGGKIEVGGAGGGVKIETTDDE